MGVTAVHVSTPVVYFNMVYALSTEREEVMSLLYGNWEDDPSNPNDSIVRIEAVTIVKRLDKRKDRVEISPETLSNAIGEAEKLNMRVVGQVLMRNFYFTISHSELYHEWCGPMQLSNRIQLISFQSAPNEVGAPSLVEVPTTILPDWRMSQHSFEQLVILPRMFVDDEQSNFERATGKQSDSQRESRPISGRTWSVSGSSFRSNSASSSHALVLDMQNPAERVNALYASSVYATNMIEILDRIVSPLYLSITERNNAVKRQIEELREKQKQ
ncbi:BRCA1 BRCA2-containing complex, subunit 3 [Gonapodya sp. JEL0774]|nr:BRCA1 BRCA2-containing complex, subunit 3 [Gonapodya sp. JEL0774]